MCSYKNTILLSLPLPKCLDETLHAYTHNYTVNQFVFVAHAV